jgi:hypothetical protein
VDADTLDRDTAPGNIVTGRTAEEGDTAMARIVREGDIDRHGPGQVAEGRKSADTMKLSATGAIEKSQRWESLRQDILGRKPGHPDCSTECLLGLEDPGDLDHPDG